MTSLRSLILLPLLLGACGDDGATDGHNDDIDAGRGPGRIDAGEEPVPCDAVTDDLSPGAPGPLDGTYTLQLGGGNDVDQSCGLSDDNRDYTDYLTLKNGIAERYVRYYADALTCNQADFDSGGEVSTLEQTTWRTCGPVFQVDGATVQQTVALYKTREGEIVRWYFYSGAGQTSDAWDEIVISGAQSDVPIEESPDRLSFQRWRRPR
jgi:hypothetical protein